MSKNKKGCFILILIGSILLLLAGGIWFSLVRYQKLQNKITDEISKIEPFDKNQASKATAEELKLTLPIQKSTMTDGKIREVANKELKEMAKKSVPSSHLSSKTKAIIKKYRLAKEGSKVSILLKTSGQRIKGTYQGTVTDWKGKLVRISNKKYRFHDISIESRYFFDAAISQKRTTDEIAREKIEFKENRKKIIDKNKDKILAKHFTNAGYRNRGDGWKPGSVIFKEVIQEKENKYQKDFDRQSADIYEENKLFGLISIPPGKDSSGDETNQHDKKEESEANEVNN